MLKTEYEKWLKEDKGLSSAENYISRIETLERYYGDIDVYYALDKCTALLCEFEYTDDDARLKKKPLHKIPIKTMGQDIYISYLEGTRDYRSRIRKYVAFRNGFMTTIKTVRQNSISQLTANEILWARELIKVAEKQPPYFNGLIEYGQLDDVTGTKLKYGNRPFNEVSGEMLGNISTFCHKKLQLPLISAIVVPKYGDSFPSYGFLELMQQLGIVSKIPAKKTSRIF